MAALWGLATIFLLHLPTCPLSLEHSTPRLHRSPGGQHWRAGDISELALAILDVLQESAELDMWPLVTFPPTAAPTVVVEACTFAPVHAQARVRGAGACELNTSR